MDTSFNIPSSNVHNKNIDDVSHKHQQLLVSRDYGATGNQDRQNNGSKTGGRKLKYSCYCIFCIILILVALISVTIGVVFLIYFNDSYDSTSYSSILRYGDSIPLLEGIRPDKGNVTAHLFINKGIGYVSLYKVKCSELSSYIKINDACPNHAYSHNIPSGSETSFTSCWAGKSGKCPIDQYSYLLKESGASITYNITVHEYGPPNATYDSEFRFLVYDDVHKFNNYMNGYGENTPIYTVSIVGNTVQTVVFGYNEMIKYHSYYFFVIELVTVGNPEYVGAKTFIVNRHCVIASYGSYDLPKLSAADSCSSLTNYHGSMYTSCSIPLSLTDSSCILGYYYNGRTVGDIYPPAEIYWTYTGGKISNTKALQSGFYTAGISLISLGGYCLAPILTCLILLMPFILLIVYCTSWGKDYRCK